MQHTAVTEQQGCQPLHFGGNDYALWTLIMPLRLSSPGARFTKNLTTNLGKLRMKCDSGKS